MIFVQVQLLDATELALTYKIDNPPEGEIRGRRVLVPVGRHQRLGIILGLCDSEPEGISARSIISILDSEPIISEELLNLCQRVSSYYLYPLGLTFLLTLPELLRKKSPEKDQVFQMTKAALLTVSPDEIKDKSFNEQLRELFSKYPSGVPHARLKEHLKSDWQRFMTRARKKGWISITLIPDESVMESSFGQSIETFIPDKLTADQKIILNEAGKALDRTEFSPYLLYGVTGSGKTEVYLRLVEKALAMGKSAD
jgi:primosomal protein N' (replication factor Y)